MHNNMEESYFVLHVTAKDKRTHTTATCLYRVQKNRHNKKITVFKRCKRKELPGRWGQCLPVGRKEKGMTGAEGQGKGYTRLAPFSSCPP